MIGINNRTGTALEGIAHLRQSITDILTTPLGSRVMRRDYGSRLFALIDSPTNPATMIDIYAATAEALDKWEPRLQLTRVTMNEVTDTGKVSLNIEGVYLPDGQAVSLDGIVL
ncbi:MAG: GPW/gp25 family protein [Methyloprofundus sp.]|nr:GPW/gp25 family protein [Methyloprofundus sp.]